MVNGFDSELEQEVSLYRLENEKVTQMETNSKEVKQVNNRLERQYDDLLNKYKSCIESNEKECKNVVNENNELKNEYSFGSIALFVMVIILGSSH